mgnify:CR=1 FL=1
MIVITYNLSIMKKISKIFLVLSLFFIGSTAFTQGINLYKDAPEEVQKTIAQVDDLIKQKKYSSAFYFSYPSESDYYVYKKVEVCTQYFIFSMMHQMFSFRDLKSGEDLIKIRQNISNGSEDMTFNSMMFDPVEYIETYAKSHDGMTPVLYLALGDYYFDVLYRYGKQWLKSEEELNQLIAENYQKSIDKGVYTERSLTNYISYFSANKCDEESLSYLKMLTDNYPQNGKYWFNTAVAYINLERLDETIQAAQNAIKYPETEIDFQIDAYLILSDAYQRKRDMQSSIKVLNDCCKKYKKEPVPKYYLGMAYFMLGDFVNTEKLFVELFKIGYSDQMFSAIMNMYAKYGYPNEAISLLKKLSSVLKKDNYGLGIVYFYQAQFYVAMTDLASAKKAADQSVVYLNKAGDKEAVAFVNDFAVQTGLTNQ